MTASSALSSGLSRFPPAVFAAFVGGGGLGGLFMMGIFTERIGTRSAFAGFVGSIVILLIVNSYSNVSFLLYGFIGLASCFLIGYLSSFVFGRGK